MNTFVFDNQIARDCGRLMVQFDNYAMIQKLTYGFPYITLDDFRDFCVPVFGPRQTKEIKSEYFFQLLSRLSKHGFLQHLLVYPSDVFAANKVSFDDYPEIEYTRVTYIMHTGTYLHFKEIHKITSATTDNFVVSIIKNNNKLALSSDGTRFKIEDPNGVGVVFENVA